MKDTKVESEDFQKILRDLKPADFTGKTDFHALKAEQKLEWLAAMVVFVYEAKAQQAAQPSAKNGD